MAGTQRTRAELFEDFDAPFQTGAEPTNADFQDFGASFQRVGNVGLDADVIGSAQRVGAQSACLNGVRQDMGLVTAAGRSAQGRGDVATKFRRAAAFASAQGDRLGNERLDFEIHANTVCGQSSSNIYWS